MVTGVTSVSWVLLFSSFEDEAALEEAACEADEACAEDADAFAGSSDVAEDVLEETAEET
jgi:hypothetical protein